MGKSQKMLDFVAIFARILGCGNEIIYPANDYSHLKTKRRKTYSTYVRNLGTFSLQTDQFFGWCKLKFFNILTS